MAPLIRVGLIGLSSSAKTSWASSAHLPYLLSPTGSAKFEIVALLNSSVDAAKSAIVHYKLPASTRAYGNPDDLAADPDVDLVVCNTRVDKHHETIRPSVAAGKLVYSEWPLTQDVEHTKDLYNLAKEKGTLHKTVVGVQGGVTTLAEKLREVLAEGRIGKVLSVEVISSGGVNDRDTLPTYLSYFTERKIGGNPFTIGFAHLFDFVQSVNGDVSSIKSTVQLQRPLNKIIDKATGEVVETKQSDVPDLIHVQGKLADSPNTAKDATINFRFRKGQPFPGDWETVWTVVGEKGELRVTSPGAALQVASNSDQIAIKLHDFAKSGELEEIKWKFDDWQLELPVPARNVGKVYEAIAKGGGYPTFELALKRHEQLQEILGDWKA
ncbi:oxidoreductase family protein [Bombardia bombarda]|uniref:Oxidoreductase family protein n=1 Tax=Bombardia bombarda TaxID=252184 RepID=A0AA39X8T9_9PEZI|nr:oxidoreductase family protein [Bombardia bombarda]